MTTRSRIAIRPIACVVLVTCGLLAVSSSLNKPAVRDASQFHPVYARAGPSDIFSGIIPPGDEGSSTSTESSTSSTTSTSSSTSTETSTSTTQTSTSTSSSVETTSSSTPDETSTTTSATSTTASSTKGTTTKPTATGNTNTNVVVNTRTGVTLNTASYGNTYHVTQSANVDDGSTDDTNTESADSSNNGGFMSNKGAVAATFTVVGLVGAGLVIFVGLFLRRRMRDRYTDKSDWDEVNDNGDSASMAEFTSASGHARGGLGTTAVLPSAAAALARQPSNRAHEEIHYEDRPDSMLAMPPVLNHERPRDSAYDIVPAAPPSGLAPPQLRDPGNTTSFGSTMGTDPFAGGPPMPWQDAQRDSAYGPGQAGRGAGAQGAGGGYSMGAYGGGVGVAMGGEEEAYGGQQAGAYGDQQAGGYQYSYPSHAYGQQYAGNAQPGGNAGYGYGYGQ